MIYLTNTFLILPIILCFVLYVWKLVESKKDVLFGELSIFLMVLSFCGYLLTYYRIHHSYENLNYELIFSSILVFYVFVIPYCLIYFLLQYKSLKLPLISFKYLDKLSNLFIIFQTNTSPKKNISRIIFFITLGIVMTLLNRSTFLICDNPILVNVYENYPFIASLAYKIHTICFFGTYILILGLVLLFDEIYKSKKIIYKIVYFIILLPLFFSLILSHSGGSGLIISYFLIVVLIATKNNKNIFQFHLIFLCLSIFVFMSMKKEIRASMPSDNSCKLGFHINPLDITVASSKFFKTPDMKYNIVTGEFIYLSLDEVSPARYRIANIFERIDFLQMLSQIKFLIKNNLLEYKKGETYLNREINWKRQFGYDLKQLHPETVSSFNMPAIIESYYNFGVNGIFIFGLIAGTMNLFFFKIIRKFNNNFYFQTILIISFSHFLIHENDFIFAIKNIFYTFALLLSVYIFIEITLKKVSNIK